MAVPTCGATSPNVIGRCGRDQGHDGDHRTTGPTFTAYWPNATEDARATVARVEEMYAVDCRDDDPAFACILTADDKAEALTVARRLGRPSRRPRIVTTVSTHDWEPYA